MTAFAEQVMQVVHSKADVDQLELTKVNKLLHSGTLAVQTGTSISYNKQREVLASYKWVAKHTQFTTFIL